MGAGLMGEQGVESIHAHIGWLEGICSGISNPLQKLCYVFNEHNLESAPGSNNLQPAPKHYKKRRREEWI